MILPERVFGNPGANWMRSGEAIGPISFRTQSRNSIFSASDSTLAVHQRDIAIDALALHRVGIADDRGLRHFRVRHERQLDFRRAHAMAGDIDHVVDPAGDPVIAVRVAAAAVAGEVLALVGGEIGVDEALVVAKDGARYRGPGIEDHEIAGDRSFEQVALAVDDCRLDAEKWLGWPNPA